MSVIVTRDAYGPVAYFPDRRGFMRKERLRCRSDHANFRLAREMAADIEACGFRRFAGVLPLNALFQKYLDELAGKGRSPLTIRHYRHFVGRVIRRCGWKGLCDITERSFLKWRKGCDLSAAYLDEHLLTAAMFIDWLVVSGYAYRNPLRKTPYLARGRRNRETSVSAKRGVL